MRIPLFAAFLAVPTFGIAAALAQGANLPDDVVTPVAGVDMLCAGTTMESREAWSSRGFALRLEFVGKGGQYLGDEDVTITGRDFNAQVRCQGPWVLMDLPPGAYHVAATVADAGNQEVDLTIAANARRISVMRFENAGGARAPAGQGASPEEEATETTRMNRDNAAASGRATAQYAVLTKQRDDLAKALADQTVLSRQHRETNDKLAQMREGMESRLRALTEKCAGVPAEYDALEKRRAAQKSWTVSQTKSFNDAQEEYTAKKIACDEGNRSAAAEQSQYEVQRNELDAILAKDREEGTRLAAQFTQVQKNLDSYTATVK
jgi:hypothetical protein